MEQVWDNLTLDEDVWGKFTQLVLVRKKSSPYLSRDYGAPSIKKFPILFKRGSFQRCIKISIVKKAQG